MGLQQNETQCIKKKVPLLLQSLNAWHVLMDTLLTSLESMDAEPKFEISGHKLLREVTELWDRSQCEREVPFWGLRRPRFDSDIKEKQI